MMKKLLNQYEENKFKTVTVRKCIKIKSFTKKKEREQIEPIILQHQDNIFFF